jgi:hypothetical protein
MRHVLLTIVLLTGLTTSLRATGTFTVKPDTGAAGTSVVIKIVGTGTSFTSNGGSPVNVALSQGFTAILGPFFDATVQDDTHMSITLVLPDTAATGWWDMQIFSSNYQYNGYHIFYVSAAQVTPTIAISPDTGVGGATFNVAISGQRTNFHPTTKPSELSNITIELRQNGYLRYRVSPGQVTSSTSMAATFILPDTLTAGAHDLELKATSPVAYDLHTTFYVAARPVIELPHKHFAKAGDTVSVDVVVHGAHVPNPETYVEMVLDRDRAVMCTPQSIAITSDTTFTAVFPLAPSTPAGPYDIQAGADVGPLYLIAETKNLFTVEAASGVAESDLFTRVLTDLLVSPNPAGSINRGTRSAADPVLTFSLSRAAHVSLRMYDALGRSISMLCDRMLSTGPQRFEWSIADAPAGSYFYELIAGEELHGGRIVVRH